MKSYIILFFVFALYSCETTTHQTVIKKKSDSFISNNLDTLSQLIDLSNFKPKSVSWTLKKLVITNDQTACKTDDKLQALLTFEDTTIAD